VRDGLVLFFALLALVLLALHNHFLNDLFPDDHHLLNNLLDGRLVVEQDGIALEVDVGVGLGGSKAGRPLLLFLLLLLLLLLRFVLILELKLGFGLSLSLRFGLFLRLGFVLDGERFRFNLGVLVVLVILVELRLVLDQNSIALGIDIGRRLLGRRRQLSIIDDNGIALEI
jgi:hypothetical protein